MSEHWESRGPRRAPAPADTPEGLLSSPDRLSELCQGDSAAMRGARVVLGMVMRGELAGAPAGAGLLALAAAGVDPPALARALWDAVGEDGERAREVGAGLRAVVSELMALAGGGGR